MKKFITAIIMLAIIGTISSCANNNETKMLRHVVLFKFKDDATPGQVKQVEDAFRALPSKIKEIKAFEWGTNNSPEGLSQGLTHCFFVSFASEKDREVYLPHPEHKAFVSLLQPYLDKATVVDYWAQD
ncbi:MAG: Dabb family protein [Chitinophagaceae bacterium]|nr:Dabb family protein [Chitinophagaceae bacterium]